MKPTREQILSEPAGPKLDAWVARFVLGYTFIPYPWPDNHPGEIAKHSSDIAAAWQVVEKIGGINLRDWGRQGWTVYFDGPDGRIGEYVLTESVCVAICRAALLAVIG